MKSVILFVLVGLAVSASVSFVGKEVTPEEILAPLNSKHFINIVKQELGEITLHQMKQSREHLERWASGSVLHSMDNVVVYLVEAIPESMPKVDFKDTNSYELFPLLAAANTITDIADLNVSKRITVVNFIGKNASEVEQSISDASNILAGKSSSQILLSAPAEELRKLLAGAAAPKRNLGDEPTATDTSYLIKFIFSIVFIIVTASVLISIADMKNQRDTLLYAKFIADINN